MSEEEDLIQKAIEKASDKAPSTVESLPPPKPKPPERPQWENIKDTRFAKMLDDFILKTVNLAVFRNTEVKMEDSHNIGGALLYTIAYYAPAVGAAADSPLTVILGSLFFFSTDLMSKLNEARKPKPPPTHPLET